MPNIFDERGVIIQGIDEVRSNMAQEAKIRFSYELGGKELKVDDSSVLGRLFAIVSKPAVQNAEILPLILQAMDINSAEGQQLDNLLWNIHRIKRLSASQASAYLILHGDIGVVVPIGSEVSNYITGDTYATDSSVTFNNVDVNGVDIQINSVGGTYELSYSINGLLSQPSKIIVQLGASDNTTSAVADRLVDAINSQSGTDVSLGVTGYLTATKNNDNSVKVVITDQSDTGTFNVSGGISIPRSYVPVYATSTTYNSSESLANQITRINSSILGWRGVTNPFYNFASSPVESDEDYRFRGKLKLGGGLGKYSSILMALKSVRGVRYENVQINSSSNPTNSGITNNGLAITVQGGDENEIALAIFNTISCGIATSGDIVKEVKDINGFAHEIRFSRPKLVPISITMSLTTQPDFPANGIQLIKQAIIEWFNNSINVRDDIHYSRLFEPINTVRGFAVRNLKLGIKGGTLSSEDVIIAQNEIATISAEDIIIGGI